MISIGKLTSAEAAVAYLQHAVADNAIDYYNLRGEAPGRWDGRGADELGLSGEVTAEQLRAVLNGVHPTEGKQLGRRWDAQKIVAFDVTFSAPKSVSLLYALGDDETRRVVLDAHDAGVDAVVTYLQAHAGWTRMFIPANGRVEPVPGRMIMPRFRHRTARPVTDLITGETTIDPQLHTHIPVPTWVCRPNGTWSALLSEPLYMHAAAAGAVGQAAMRKVLIDRLGVAVEVAPNGTFEIVGINEAQRREFSKRRQQIEAAEATFGIETIRGRETANLATREGKGEAGAGPELFQQWTTRGQLVGLYPQLISDLTRKRVRSRRFELTPDLATGLVGEHGLTAEAATFARRDVVRSVAALAADGITHAEIEQLVDAVLADAVNVVALGPKPVAVQVLDIDRDHSQRIVLREDRFSTPEMVALERRMLDVSRARQRQGVALVDDAGVEASLAKRPTLSVEQRAMVNAVTRGGDGVVIVEGVAGAGKTFALDACREAFEAAGHNVIGYALAGRAAQTLQEEAAIPSHTIARAIPALLEERFAPGTVVIVDEAGMVGSRQLAQLVELTARDGAKLVLCGDPHQLQPIDGGAGFRALGDHLGKVELTQSLRQSELWEREALMMVREGAMASAVEEYQKHERITVASTAMERRHQAVAALIDVDREGSDTVILTRTRDEADAINELTRAVLQQRGDLTGEALVVGDREYQVGDRVICTRNDRRLGVTNGLRGVVTDVDVERGALMMQTSAGQEMSLDTTHYSHLDHAFALTAHRAQGMTADVALVVGSEAASREWAYSVMSRARTETRYFTIASPPSRDIDGVHHGREPERTLAQRLVQAWSPSEAKDSTLDYTPPRPLRPEEDVLVGMEVERGMRR